MSIEVRVPTVLRKHTAGQKTVTGEGATLGDLVADLEARNAGLGSALVADDGTLRRFINVYVNDEDVRYLGGMDTALNEGDTVTILPAVAGGGG